MIKKNLNKATAFQQAHEKFVVETKLKNFDLASSRAWAKLTARFGPKITQEELLSLAQICSIHTQIDLHREFKRRKKMLIIWFEEHFETVWPFIENSLIITDKDHKIINYELDDTIQFCPSPS